jgi:hypothetical protein
MKFKFLISLIIITLSCYAQNRSPFKIDPRTFFENKITLADIADDIIYIPLDNKFPIGSILSFKVLKNSIYISAKDIGVVRFNIEGKNPKKIGKIGRGPGEYSTVWSFAVNDKNETVYILDWRKIEVFSKNGDFLRSIPLPECNDGKCFLNMDFYNSNLVLFQYIDMGRAKYNWIIKDTLGNLVKEKKNSLPAFPNQDSGSGGIYKYKDKISYWNYYNDTVFTILPDLSYSTSILFAAGNYRLPRQGIKSTSSAQYFSQLNKYFTPQWMFETNRFIGLVYRFEQKRVLALLDKVTKKSYLSYLENNGNGGILNNLDGGPSFQTTISFEKDNDEYLVGFLEPLKLKSHITSSEFKNTNSIYPEKKKNLEKLANSIKETDNQILMLVKLKK